MANLSNINDKFLVTTGGNVLIGQTAAVGSSILQVTGSSTFTPISTVSFIVTNSGNDLRLISGVPSGVTWIGKPVQYYASEYSFSTDVTGAGSYSQQLVIENNGDVGIGVSQPIKKLQVSGFETGDLINILCVNRRDQNGDTASIGFSMTDNNLYNKAAVIFERTTTQGRGSLHFATNNTNSSANVSKGDARMTILSNGNIAFNATSNLNSSNFQISTNSGLGANVDVFIANTSGTPYVNSATTTQLSMGFLSGIANYVATGQRLGALQFFGQASDAGYGAGSIKSVVTTGGNVGRSSHAADLTFETKAAGSLGNTEKMRILGNGNVGINQTSPDAKLHVMGTTGLPATSGTTFTGTMRLGVSGYGTVMDFGAVGPATGTQWIQVTDASNQAIQYPLLLQPNGGNVGIGTTSPDYGKLQIDQASGNNLTLRKGTGYAAIAFGGVTNNEATFLIEGNASEGFRVYNGTGTLASPTWTAGMDFFDQGRLHPYGGVFLGSSNNSNLLNYYASGTWTPTVTTSQGTSPTITSSSGRWQRVGKVVTASFEFTMSNPTVGGGGVIINNLPIAIADTNHVSGCGVIPALGKTINVRHYTATNQIAMNFYDGNYAGTVFRTVGTVTYWAAT